MSYTNDRGAARIKIAYLSTVAITQYNFMRGQTPFLAERGFVAHAIAAPDKYLQRLHERDETEVHPLPMSRNFSPLKDVLVFFRLLIILIKIRPDILHISTPKAAFLGAVAGWLCRVRVRIFLMRGALSIGRVGLSGLAFRMSERLTALFSHRVICVSQSLLDYAIVNRIMPASKGMVIAHGMSNGVDCASLIPQGQVPQKLKDFCVGAEVVIGFVGRLVREKGLTELEAAWNYLREKYPEIKLLLCGEWEERGGVNHCARVGITSDPRVLITGWIDKEDIGHYYRAMNILAFPSYREGFPNVPMEAAAFGLPVIVTDAVGCRDAVVDGVTGVLVQVGNASELTKAIEGYIVSPSLAADHGTAGKKRILNDFSPEIIHQGLYEEYCRLLDDRFREGCS